MREPDYSEALFEWLDEWRHYPAYRLEPRVDAIVSLYMRHVIEAHTKTELLDAILPGLALTGSVASAVLPRAAPSG